MVQPHPPIDHKGQSPSKTQVNAGLDKKLAAYMTAASTAGVALLAAVPSAEARIVYTPAHVTISPQYLLDVNRDGVADFALTICGQCPLPHALILRAGLEVHGNALRGKGAETDALLRGAPIGPKQGFTSANTYGGLFMAAAGYYRSGPYFFGPWAKATNRYLGLKFLIKNKVHYGWARLTVPDFEQGGKVLLSGYAYETVPNKSLRAGQRSDAKEAVEAMVLSAPQSPTLGLLARGADGLAIWRKEQDALGN